MAQAVSRLGSGLFRATCATISKGRCSQLHFDDLNSLFSFPIIQIQFHHMNKVDLTADLAHSLQCISQQEALQQDPLLSKKSTEASEHIQKVSQGSEVYESVMQWFEGKGIQRGTPQTLMTGFGLQKLRVASLRDTTNTIGSGLFAKRCKSNLTCVL